MRYWLMCCVLLLLYACGGSEEAENRGHVWKEQTDMIDKAQGVEELLGDADALQRQRIEEQAQ
jgi:hypothetical protein